jgi:TolB-like protein
MGKASFLSELKRRNVIRAAGLYLVGAWLVVQVSSTVLPMFGAPPWLPRSIVILLAIGFVPAMIFSWVFELTPEGIKRDDVVSPEESIAPQTARRLDRMIIAVLAVALLYFGFDKFVLTPRREDAIVASVQKHDASLAASKPMAATNDKSIAVLPLFNMSGDPKDSYLGDGISEEMLTALSKLPGLKVIGRASSFQFRDRDVDAVKVGHALDVRSLLGGTVQRDGDNLRISVELVDTDSGVQMWSQHYDRSFKNLFALEDDISSAVSTALAVKLGAAAGQPLVKAGTANPRAHDLYLQARKLSYSSDEAGLNQAIALFNQAIAEDPNYAAAWAGLAYTYAFLADAYRAPIDVLPSMKGAAEKAVALDPDMAEAHAYLGYILLAYERDFPAAKREFDKALALNPGSADVHFFRGIDPLWGQQPTAALAEFEAAEKIDPYNPFDPFAAMWAATAMGDEALAIKKSRRVLELQPGFFYFTDPLEYAYGSFGRWKDCIDRVKAIQAGAVPAGANNGPDFKAGVCYAHGGDPARARAILDQLETAARTRYVDHTNIAEVYMALGDKDGAMAALEQAYKDRSQPLLLMWYLPEFKPLHDDPRYKDLMTRLYATEKLQAAQ